MLSRHLQVSNARLLVAGQAAHAQKPAHRRVHAADNVLAESCGHQSVRAIVADGEQLLSPGGRLFGEVQRGQILLLNQSRIVCLQS